MSFAQSIRSIQRFFETSTKCFEEENSEYTPLRGLFTVAQHVAHSAQTIRWFVDGAFSVTGMEMDFDSMEKEVRRVVSLREARNAFAAACTHAIGTSEKKTKDDFNQLIAGTIMAGEPRCAILEAIADHTAHHRGALTVYARLLGKVPAMPYM